MSVERQTRGADEEESTAPTARPQHWPRSRGGVAQRSCVLVTASRAPKVDGRRLAREVNGLHKRSGCFVLGRRLHKMAVQAQVEVKPFVACAVEGEKDRRS